MLTDRQARSCVVGTGSFAAGRLAALTLAVALATPVVCVSVTVAQDLPMIATVAQAAPTDPKAALDAAVAQFKAGQYEEALTALQTIKADNLSSDDQKLLSDTTSEAQQAAQSRRSARADFEKGQQALDNGDNATAQGLFKSVAANPYADTGTAAKAKEQLTVADAGAQSQTTDWHAVYDQAVSDYKAGKLDTAKTEFTQLQQNNYSAPWFSKSPREYLESIDKQMSGPTSDEQARSAYLTGRDDYRKGDWIAARQNFDKSVSLGYKAGWFEDAPEKYLARMDKKEQADAAMAAQNAVAGNTSTDMAAAPTTAPAMAAAPATAPAMAVASADMNTASPTTAPAMAAAMMPAATDGASASAKPANDVAASAPAAADDQASLAAIAAQRAAEQSNKAYQAKKLVESAQAAENAQRYDEAKNLYTQATDLDPSNPDAIAGRNRTLSLTGTSPVTEDIGDRTAREIEARRQAIMFSFNQATSQAKLQENQGNFDGARTSLAQAEAASRSDPGIFKNEELQSFNQQLADARTDLERQVASTRDKQAAEAQAAAQNDAEQRAKDQAAAKERAVSSLVAQSRQLTEQGRYPEALKVVDQILVLDPRNEYATGVKQILFDRASLQNQRETREKFDQEWNTSLNEADEKRIPYSDVLTYPADWPDLATRRDQTVREERQVTAADEAVNTLLDKTLPEIRFQDVAFADVIDFLRDTTQANIFVNWKALEVAGIDRNAPVSTRLRNVKFSKVLKTVLESVGGGATSKLGYTVDEGVIEISTQEDLASNVETLTYDIRDLIISIPDFTDAPTFDLSSSQNSGGSGQSSTSGGGGGGGGQSLFSGGGGASGQDTANTPTRAELVEQITSLIRETIGVGTWKEDGGQLGSLSELGGQLIVTQTPEVHRAITSLLEKLREQRSIQVMIEARFLTVQRNFLEDVGVDFDFYFNFNNNPLSGIAPGGTFTALNSGTTSTGGSTAGTGLFSANNVVNPVTGQTQTGVAPVAVQQNSSSFTQASNLTTGVNGNLAGAFAQPNLTTTINAFLDDFQASILIRATQGNQNVTQLTAPRITLFNGQRAYVVVSTEEAYVSDLTPVVGQSSIGFDPTVSVVNSGVVLDVTATVSADRKYVTLTLRPELSTLLGLASFPVFGGATATGTTVSTGTTPTPSFDNAFGFIQEPTIQITQVRTTVSVPDGGTLLLGGTTISGEIEREAGVPVLSEIPFLKRAFTNRSYAKDEQVLLILVKPTIIIQREVEQQNFPLLTSRPG